MLFHSLKIKSMVDKDYKERTIFKHMVGDPVDILEKEIAELEAQNTRLNFLKRKLSVVEKWNNFANKINSSIDTIDDYGLTRLENLIASGQELVSSPVAEPTPEPVAEPTPAPEPVAEPVAEPVVVEEVVEEDDEELGEDEEWEYEEVEEEEEEEEITE